MRTEFAKTALPSFGYTVQEYQDTRGRKIETIGSRVKGRLPEKVRSRPQHLIQYEARLQGHEKNTGDLGSDKICLALLLSLRQKGNGEGFVARIIVSFRN